MFVLTKEEKRVVCFVLLAIMIGLAVKEYRRDHPVPVPPASKQAVKKPAIPAKAIVENTPGTQPNDLQSSD